MYAELNTLSRFKTERSSGYRLLQAEKGLREPFDVQSTIDGNSYTFDDDFVEKLDKYFAGSSDEFYPKERAFVALFLEYADGNAAAVPCIALDMIFAGKI